MSARCPWWIRWWHKRLRKADMQMMLPAIWSKVRHLPDGADRAQAAWELFKGQEGQEHWQCPCAEVERRQLTRWIR